MKLYFDLLSQPCRAVWIFMKLNKIPFEPVIVKMGRGEHMRKGYKKVNRLGTVPFMSDGDFKLNESIAMFRYLVATNQNIPDHWYPKDLRERAKVDEYLSWQHNNTRAGCAGFFLMKYLQPAITLKKPSEGRIKFAKAHMETTLNLLENVWLKDERFLATDKMSFADLMAACELEQPKIADYDPFAGRPKLTNWHERVKEETNPIYNEAHAAAFNLIGTMDKSKLHKYWKFFFSYNY